jgi:hypothetical protein
MRSEKEIRERLEKWKRFYERISRDPYDEEGGKIREELGYEWYLLSDHFYDHECAEIVIRELKWVLGEEHE